MKTALVVLAIISLNQQLKAAESASESGCVASRHGETVCVGQSVYLKDLEDEVAIRDVKIMKIDKNGSLELGYKLSNGAVFTYGQTWSVDRVSVGVGCLRGVCAGKDAVSYTQSYGVFGITRNLWLGTVDRVYSNGVVVLTHQLMTELVSTAQDQKLSTAHEAKLTSIDNVSVQIREKDGIRIGDKVRVTRDGQSQVETLQLLFNSKNEGVLALTNENPYFFDSTGENLVSASAVNKEN